VDVVPFLLPIHVSDDDREMTVAEYFGLDEKSADDARLAEGHRTPS
jgi:hypothetical protein